jgi:hypothetical protein
VNIPQGTVNTLQNLSGRFTLFFVHAKMSPFDILDYQMTEPFWHLQLSKISAEQIQIGLAFVASFFFSMMMLVFVGFLSRIPVNKKVVDAETLVLEYRTLYEGVLERIATLETELKAKDTQLGCELIEVQRNEHDHYLETTRLEAAVDAEFDMNRKDMVEMVDDKIHELREGVSMILSEKLDDLPIPDMTGELAFLRQASINQKEQLDEQTKRLNGFSAALPTLLGLDPQIKTLEAQVKALPIESLEHRLASVSKLQGLGDVYLKALETQVKSLPIEEHATRLVSLANVQAISEQNMKALIKAVETRQTLDTETIKDDLKTLLQFLTAGPYPKATALLQILEKNGWPVLQIGTLPPPPPPAAPPVNT